MRIRIALTGLALALAAPAAAQTVVTAGSTQDCNAVTSYSQVLPPKKPAGARKTASRLIVAGSEPGCAEITDPKAATIGPITIEIAPPLGRPRHNDGTDGAATLTNASPPD